MRDEVKIKQLLLEKIVELKSTYVSNLSVMLDLGINICFSYCEEICIDGYIDFIDASSNDGKDAIIKSNGKGEIFFQNGGYVKEEKDLEKEKRSQIRQRKLTNISSIILILTSIATVALGMLAYFQNNKINELQEQLKVYDKQEINNELIGRWYNSSGTDTSFYLFSADNTWEFTILSSGEKRISKGEYQIGKNKGVYLRQYGSQHWGHDTTYVDVQSGIGASYLYIENDLLINNQEDYENKYRKMK